jgi:hypothetical protein
MRSKIYIVKVKSILKILVSLACTSLILFIYFDLRSIFEKTKLKTSDIHLQNISIRINILKKVNPHSFDYLINPEYSICHKKYISFIFTVFTRVDSFDRRQLIRSLWSNQTLKSKYEFVFMIGRSLNDTINKMVRIESQRYFDIVQENFVDSYYNLTYKTVMSLEWVSMYCSNTYFVIKIDDDVSLNIKNMINYFESLNNSFRYENVFGLRCNNAKVDRNINSKFYVSKSEYSESKYPTYLAGPAYIYTTDLAEKLYHVSINIKYLSMEDVFFGLLFAYYNSTNFKLNDLNEKYYQRNGYSNQTKYFFYFHLKSNNVYRLVFLNNNEI